jgi:kynurenine formamidase
MSSVLTDLLARLADGAVRPVDLTAPLWSQTPVLRLPYPFHNSPGFSTTAISDFDERGPSCYWNYFETGEHVGTHVDAPNHWVSGRGGRDISEIPTAHLVAPAVVIDKSSEVDKDPDYLLSRADVEAWTAEHGSLPQGGWLVYRTGWSSRLPDPDAYLGMSETGAHTPGIDAACAKWLAQETGIVGIGVETVGTDAGQSAAFEPAYPVHHYMHGADKYGLAGLCKIHELPTTGAVLIVAPLRIAGGSGSPARVLALVPTD